MKEILAAHYWSVVDGLSMAYELDYAQEKAFGIVLNQITAEAARKHELLAEIHESGDR